MKKKSLFLNAAAAVVIAGTFTACEDVSICGLTEEDLDMGDAFVETTSYFMNIVSRADQAMRDNDLQTNGSAMIDGATVSLTTDSLIVDFGSTNVQTADGKQRRGRIAGALNGDYFTASSSVSLELQGYHVDDVPVTGSIALNNNGNSGGNWTINLASTNFAIGQEYAYSANLTMEWESGYSTIDSVADDVFEIYGSAGGDDLLDSISFSTAFTDPMRFDRSCQYGVTQGIVDVNLTAGNDDVAAVTVDFLDSDMCNNVLMLTATCEGTEVSFPKNFDGF